MSEKISLDSSELFLLYALKSLLRYLIRRIDL